MPPTKTATYETMRVDMSPAKALTKQVSISILYANSINMLYSLQNIYRLFFCISFLNASELFSTVGKCNRYSKSSH